MRSPRYRIQQKSELMDAESAMLPRWVFDWLVPGLAAAGGLGFTRRCVQGCSGRLQNEH